jgi:uncharacterized protein (TIGR03067 family)
VHTTLLLAALTLGAPALKDKTPPASLVGEWVIEEATVSGRPAGNENPNRWVFGSDGSQMILGPSGNRLAEGGYTADRKTGALDIDRNKPGDHYLCLYKIVGDTLTVNVGWQKAPRPTEFESPVGSQCTLYVMKRVKPKD